MPHSVYIQAQAVLSPSAASGQVVRLPHRYHGHLQAEAAGEALGPPALSPFAVVAHAAQARHRCHGHPQVEGEAEELAL